MPGDEQTCVAMESTEIITRKSICTYEKYPFIRSARIRDIYKHWMESIWLKVLIDRKLVLEATDNLSWSTLWVDKVITLITVLERDKCETLRMVSRLKYAFLS